MKKTYGASGLLHGHNFEEFTTSRLCRVIDLFSRQHDPSISVSHLLYLGTSPSLLLSGVCLSFPTTPFFKKTLEPSSQDGEVTHRILAPCGCHGLHRGLEMPRGRLCVLWEQYPGPAELSAIRVSVPASLRATRRMLLLVIWVGVGGVLPQDEQRWQRAGSQLRLWH